MARLFAGDLGQLHYRHERKQSSCEHIEQYKTVDFPVIIFCMGGIMLPCTL